MKACDDLAAIPHNLDGSISSTAIIPVASESWCFCGRFYDPPDRAVKTAGMAASGERGGLRIGIHALIPYSFLTKLICRYRKGHPGIEIEITEDTVRDTVMQLGANLLDVVFVAGTPGWHSRPIWTEPLLAVLPEQHPLAAQPATVTWGDLASKAFLGSHDVQMYGFCLEQWESRIRRR